MNILVYISAAVAYLNILAITGIIACATKNWHPIQNLIKRIK